MEPTFTLSGIKEIEKALKDLEAKVSKKITRQALRKGTKIFAKQVKDDTPVDSGTLKKQVKVKAGKRSRTNLSVNVETSSPDAFYGAFQELGTSKTPATHYQHNAFQKVKDEVMRVVLTELKNGIENATSR